MRAAFATGTAALTTAGLLLSAGCTAFIPEPSISAHSPAIGENNGRGESPEHSGFGLREALDASLSEQLEVETVASLGRIAAEHVHNDTLLRLPGIRAEFRSPSPPPVETGLALLDGAIAYNHILSAPPGTELSDERRPRVRQLLELSGAECWASLAAVREKIELSGGIGTPELRQQEAELLLELRISTGFDNDLLLSFDYSTLPMPGKLDTPLFELQQKAVLARSETTPLEISEEFPRQIRRLFSNDPAALPMLAEALYRLPRKLAELQLASPTRDLSDLAALGSAAGIVCEVELCRDRLQEAWTTWEAARLKVDGSPESRIALAEAVLQWRLARFQLEAAMGGGDSPAIAPPRKVNAGTITELLQLLSTTN